MRGTDIVAVVVVGDVRYVRDVRVGNVHVAEVIVADISATAIPAAVSPAAVARVVGFTPAQWEPSEAYAAKAEADAESRAADPAHKGGSVIRTPVAARTRGPRPASAPVDPAAIVERRKAPRLIVNPRPAPGSDPNPVSEAVR